MLIHRALQGQPFLSGSGSNLLDRLRQALPERERLALEHNHSRLDFGEVQYVIDYG